MADPQSTLEGARGDSLTPQSAPPQLNANKVDMQSRMLQQSGMGTAQAMNKAAQNPTNAYAQGGAAISAPPTPDEIRARLTSMSNDKQVQDLATALKGVPATKDDTTKDAPPLPQHKPATNAEDRTKQMMQEYTKNGGGSPPSYGGYAQGGGVHENIKNMSLKDVIKLLASHPELMGQGATNDQMGSTNMRSGGAVSNGKRNLTANVDTYADGGATPDDEVQDNNAGSPDLPPFTPGLLKMAQGGSDLEADSIVSYGPDGTPITQNSDGTQQYGDINQLLGRPESAPTLGTGITPTTSVSSNAANSVAQQQVKTMAKGGSDAPPPGSNKAEVSDNIPARLSPGEFVFSADATRYYGLRFLNGLMEHARMALEDMKKEGNIKSPGEDISPTGEGSFGHFLQDDKPNMNAYGPNGENKDDSGADDDVTGLLKECMGGPMAQGGGTYEGDEFKKGGLLKYAAGGTVGKSVPKDGSFSDTNQHELEEKDLKSEDEHEKEVANTDDKNEATDSEIQNPNKPKSLKKGGSVDNKQFGRDNMISAHPKGGAVDQDYAKGGVVTATSSNLTPKKFESEIPTGGQGPKIPRIAGLSLPKVNPSTVKKPSLNQGGLLRDPNLSQSIVGA